MKSLIAILCFTYALANAQSVEPFSIKGLRIGLDKPTVMQRIDGSLCMTDGSCIFLPNRGQPNELDTVAGVRVESIHVSFHDGKLDAVRIKLKADYAPTITDALIGKFGKPKIEEEEFKTKGGYVGKKHKWTWTQDDAELVAESPSGNINDMFVRLYSKAYRARLIEKSKESATKDL